MSAPVLGKYVRPEALSRIAHHDFTPKQLVEGSLAGAHKSPFHGFAVEFAAHRQYVPGDDVRHLDWKVYFRRDKLVIKQYEMETNLSCHLMIDASASMRYGDEDQQKLLYAARAATTLGYLIVEQSDRVSLTVFDEEIRHAIPPGNTMAQIVRITETLDQISPTEKTSIGNSLLELASRAGRRGIVIVYSDFFVDLDDLERALQRLRYDNHEVVLFQTLHHDELHFDLPGMVRFEGLEDEDAYLTRPEDIKATYMKALTEFNQKLTRIAEANHCEHLICDTSRPLAEMLANYLQQRSLVRRRW